MNHFQTVDSVDVQDDNAPAVNRRPIRRRSEKVA